MNPAGTRKPLRILIRGGAGLNKGDELMKRAVIQHFALHGQAVDLVGYPWIGDYRQRVKEGMLMLLWSFKLTRLQNSLGYLMLKRYRQHLGVVLEKELDAVLDLKGYAYGDPWGVDNPVQAVSEDAPRHKRSLPIIYLPQAFGPFEVAAVRDASAELFKCATLMFARDVESLGYLQQVVPERDKLAVAPDFTIGVKGTLPAGFQPPGRWACIIPNKWMIERKPEDAAVYIKFLARAAGILREQGLTPCLLPHTTRLDDPVIEALQKELPTPLPVIREDDPQHLKGIIGTAELVISSRYHGLMAGLSQNVPCIGTSWSHKYQGLFADYGCPDWLLQPDVSSDALARVIKDIVQRRPMWVERLSEKNKSFLKANNDMWARVDNALGLT